jgi:2-oxoglutarate dehydrogenase E2 component (dihydrolipoamide succinyltransferase)
MTTEIRVPTLGESVVEATVGQWFKQAGDQVTADEPLVELETDKVTVEVPAPASGVLAEIAVKAGDTVAVGAVLGAIRDADGKQPPAKIRGETKAAAAPAAKPKLEREPSPREEVSEEEMPPSPAARKLLAESGLAAKDVAGSGRRGQVLRQDIVAKTPAPSPPAGDAGRAAEALLARERTPKPPAGPRPALPADDAAREERVRMTRLRQTIAKRLKEAQDVAAMLTTLTTWI